MYRGSTSVGRSCKQAWPTTRNQATSNTSWQPDNCIHTYKQFLTKVCRGQICASSCSVSIVCLSCIYPACCRLLLTACQICVWTLKTCVQHWNTEIERERREGERRVRWDGISGNCLLFSLSVSREISALHCLISSLILSFCFLGHVHAIVDTFEIVSFSLSILAFHPH